MRAEFSCAAGWPIALLATAFATAAHAQDRVLDDFENPAAWTISAPDDVKVTLRSADGPQGKALCIDYDFGSVTGYVAAKRLLPITYPARHEFTLDVRGGSLPNAFQFKLVDASGENVWWGQKPEYRFPAEWQTLKFRQRQIEFAWGPAADRVLRQTASAELVIASGSGAGEGSACFARLMLRELPSNPPAVPAPKMLADGLGVDLGLPREFGALVIPGQVAMLPLFLMLKPLGLINSYGGAIVPAMASVFGIFLVRQFARGIPDDLLEAARIDGASEWRIFITIIVPLLRPMLATLAIFSFLGSWNDFMWPLIVLTDDSLHTLPVALAGLSREHVQDSELMMAGSVVTVLPVLVLFLALQRQYMEGLMAGGVKG